MANNNISIQICGRPSSSGGFSTIYIKNSVIIDDKKEDVYEGFGANSYFFTIKIEKAQVVYKLVKNNIFSKNSSRSGWLQIAIAIPKGFILDAGVSPYDVLIELKKGFLSRCMTCKDLATEKYEFCSDMVQPTILDDIASLYSLVPVQMPYRPMTIGAPIAYVTATEDKIELLMKDIQYSAFEKFSEIVVAETVQSTNYISISNISIPRMPEFTVYEDGAPISVLSDAKQAYTATGKGDPRFFENGSLTFTLEDVLLGNIIPNVTIDKANETININTQSLVSPKTLTVNLVFYPKESETYFYTKRDEWNLLYGNHTIPLSKDLSFSVSGENINILYNQQNFKIAQSRRDQYVVTNIKVALNEIQVYAEKVERTTPAGGVHTGAQQQESLVNACEVQLLMDAEYVRTSLCSFMFYDSEDRLLQNTNAFFSRVQGGNVLAKAYIPKSWASSHVQVRVKLANNLFNFGNLSKDKNGVIDLSAMEFSRKSIGFFNKHSKAILLIGMLFISLLVGCILGAYVWKNWLSNDSTNNQPESISCSICGITYDSNIELTNHMSNEHSQDVEQERDQPEELYCEDCNAGPFDNDELTSHKLNCPQKVKCDKCGAGFASNSELTAHKSSAHPDVNYHCDICNRDFTSSASLRSHKADAHSPKECKHCHQFFDDQKALNAHMYKDHHFVCAECGPSTYFPTQADLDTHKRGKRKDGKNHTR